jgi:hypothetical protein
LAPEIYDHKTLSIAVTLNWNISLRVKYWSIKSYLEAAYFVISAGESLIVAIAAVGVFIKKKETSSNLSLSF